MVRLDDPGLDPETARGLVGYQTEVDAARDYAEQVRVGKTLFERYNRPNNRVFRGVRGRLVDMCSGAQRCCYCEDSAGDEVEHIRPKELYPDRVFAWENYLLACGQCNRSKGSRFSVIDAGVLVDVTRTLGAPVERPRDGQPALIIPRAEDPLRFLDLEIVETFTFLPREGLTALDEDRAAYTVDLLRLNREVLRVARRNAYGAYRGRLAEYRELRVGGAGAEELNHLMEAILTSDHPTVWREMQRQQSMIDELRALFLDVPEALRW